MGAVNGIYLPIHKHDQLMKLLRIKRSYDPTAATKMSILCWLIEVIFLLEFYYL